MIQSNASNICSRLEKADLIRRKRCEQDQRAVYVTLTEAARCQIAEIQTSVDQFHQTVSENITPQDFSDIKNGLIKLNRLFDLF
jgi:DNA-binding MarR family transcriptional regulator